MCFYGVHIAVETVKIVGFDGLKAVGISTAKATYIQNVLPEVESDELVFEDLRDMDDNNIIKKLKKIKGIGKWTAKMYLLFVLGRDNILPYEDGAFLQGYKLTI